jgi:hypothetical protein
MSIATATHFLRTASARKTATPKVDISKLNDKELDALPEDVFLASLKPHARRFALAAFKLKGIR